jgi:pyridoxamine 5'-phosphate oxidase
LPEAPLNIADIRQDYKLAALDEDAAGQDPLAFFHKWFADAQAAHITEVNAMTLATADSSGIPHARILLLKGLDSRGFVFYTNYDGAKGHQIADTGHVALVFFWKELERQVRIEGRIEKVSAEESDTYFHSRPTGSQLGAWASPQSSIIPDRQVLDDNYKKYEAEFAGKEIPRPPHWGGYRVIPNTIEFWQGRASRMHDRILFTATEERDWRKSRLAP